MYAPQKAAHVEETLEKHKQLNNIDDLKTS